MSDELAGAMRERVTHLLPGDRDAAGAPTAFVEGEELWAAIVPERPRIGVRGERRAQAERWKVTLRAGAGVHVGDRLHWRDAAYDVVSVIADPRLMERQDLLMERLS
ncbi:head-tail adaptor protein [Pacificimonas sp. WHA3]|uniref:Head-tail adaptor protein n=1 Tax=Pacificimonas pallii TaxID=2827236 RepID=A0ABS6SA18_9SPHN|nr:head-tail adaptor protein [Pacificimonas pallii]MBV7255208.1 head-tail adaptor protein [Pacificimonas pallii]